jgi:hypothetical protein
MALGVRRFQVGDGQAEITFSGSQGLLPQQVLDMPQVRVVLHQMSRASVPPHVRCHNLLDLNCLGVFPDQGTQRSRRGVKPYIFLS